LSFGVGSLINKFDFAESAEHGHGRDEIRRAWLSHAVEEISSSERWSGLTTFVRIESTRTVNGKTSAENRFYISSRKTLSAKQALSAVRDHWSIENQLHWVLDVAFREDDCRVRAVNAAANFSALRQLAVGLLKQRTEARCGIKNRRLMAGWDDLFLLRVVG